MRASEVINELFDSQGIEWEDDTHARFNVNGESFMAWFRRDAGGGNYYDFQFAHEQQHDDGVLSTFSNTGKIGAAAPRVLAYAVQCIEEFISKKRPRSLGFRGKKEDGRDRLYAKMAPVLSKRLAALGYTLKTRTVGRGPSSEGGIQFTLYRD